MPQTAIAGAGEHHVEVLEVLVLVQVDALRRAGLEELRGVGIGRVHAEAEVLRRLQEKQVVERGRARRAVCQHVHVVVGGAAAEAADRVDVQRADGHQQLLLDFWAACRVHNVHRRLLLEQAGLHPNEHPWAPRLWYRAAAAERTSSKL
jgi:hypothetical protein